jgi:uncharacterized membrane protein
MDRRVSERAFVAGLLAIATVLRVLHLGYQSIWVDEAMTLDAVTPKDGYSIWHLLLHNIHGPLHAFVVYLFRLVADTDAWVRMPSVVAGVAGVGVFYAWTSRWLGRRVARTSALLLAIHPLHIHYSQEVRNYAFVVLFGVLACYAFERWTARTGGGGRRWPAAYALSMAAALLSNFSAAFLFAAHTAIVFLRRGLRWSVAWRWVAITLTVLVLVSPWVYRVYTFIDVGKLVTPVMPGEIETSERLRGTTTVTWAALPYTFYTYSIGFTLGPSLRELHDDLSVRDVVARHWPAVGWVAALFGTLALLGLARSRARGELALYVAFPIVLTLLLNWQNAKAFNARYVLVGLPAYLCLVATAAVSPSRRPRVVVLLACALTMMASLANYYFNGRYAKEDVKRATRYVEKRIEAIDSDGCVFAPTIFRVVERYRRGEWPIYNIYNRETMARSRVDAQLAPLFAACNSVWYLRARPWVDDPDGYLTGELRARYTVVEQAQFDGLRVIHFVRDESRAEPE